MKKNAVIIVSVIAFALTSCGGGNSSSKSKAGEIDNQETANQVIVFNNEVVKYLNDTSDKIKKTAKFLKDMDNVLKTKRDSRSTENRYTFIGVKISADKILSNVPQIISAELKKNLTELDKNYQLIQDENKLLTKYRENQDYKDDNWKKGAESVTKMTKAVENYYIHNDLILKELSIVGDKAEEKILENHPLRDPILAAKKDIKLATDLRELLFAKKLDRDAIKIAYDVLEKNSKQHKEEFNKTLTEQGKKDSYDSFHEEINDYLGEIRKRLRFNREFDTADFNSISSDFEYIVKDYNSFVG